MQHYSNNFYCVYNSFDSVSLCFTIYTAILGLASENIIPKNTAKLLTSLMLCALISYVSGWIYSLTSIPNDRLFLSLFTARVLARNLQGGNRRGNISFFIFRFDAWSGIWTRTLHLISQHTTDQTTATMQVFMKNKFRCSILEAYSKSVVVDLILYNKCMLF